MAGDKQIKITISAGILLELVFLLFFCDKAFASVIARTLGPSAINFTYNLVFIVLIFAYLLLKAKDFAKNILVPLLLFFLIALLFSVTYMLHPEYEPWFNHPVYGISVAIANPRCAIWAFPIVWMIKEEGKIYKYLKLAAWVCLAFYILQFLAATSRGYWVEYSINGEIQKNLYSLEFGYDMVFPVSFMGAYAFIKGKRLYYIPYFIGLLIILFGGSRGAVIWPIAMFPLMLPFKWKNMNKKQRLYFTLIIIPLLLLAILSYIYSDILMVGLSSLLEKYGKQSRTLTSILSGAFSDANGRDDIYSMAIELIKTGGPFGWGVYGDRNYIGRYYQWGYSHNLFLELFVSFGYVGGTIVCILLVSGVIKLYSACKEKNRQIVFITFLVTSFKLMLSNSFWYMKSFWALLALIIMWGRNSKLSEYKFIWTAEKLLPQRSIK